MEKPLPLDWGYWAQLLARRQVARLQPPSVDLVAPALPRQLRRRPVDRQPRRQDLHQAPRRRAVQPLLADVGRRQRDLLRRRSAAQRQEREAGQPRGAQERQQHLQDPAAGGGQPTQVTKHIDGARLLALDVERRQGHRLRGQLRHLEAGRRQRPDQRDQARHRHRREGQRAEIETVTNEVDNFDISPSGRRAVISARGQILTIATDRGDITRVEPDKMASRSDSPKWSADGKYVAFISDDPGRDEVWISRSRGADAEEDHRPRQREGRARLDAGLEAAALHGRRQEAVQLRRRRREDSGDLVERRRAHRLGRRSRPTASGSRSRSRIARCARTSTSRRSAAARSVTSPTTA